MFFARGKVLELCCTAVGIRLTVVYYTLKYSESCSVTQLCPPLFDPMDFSPPGFPVLHHLLKFAQTHVDWVSDAVKLSHPLLPPSPPAFNLSPNQGLFHLPIRWPKNWSFSFSISPSNEYSGLISFRMDWLHLLAVKGLSRVYSKTTVQNHQFFGAELSLWSNSHIHTWLLEKPQLWLDGPLLAK